MSNTFEENRYLTIEEKMKKVVEISQHDLTGSMLLATQIILVHMKAGDVDSVKIMAGALKMIGDEDGAQQLSDIMGLLLEINELLEKRVFMVLEGCKEHLN